MLRDIFHDTIKAEIGISIQLRVKTKRQMSTTTSKWQEGCYHHHLIDVADSFPICLKKRSNWVGGKIIDTQICGSLTVSFYCNRWLKKFVVCLSAKRRRLMISVNFETSIPLVEKFPSFSFNAEAKTFVGEVYRVPFMVFGWIFPSTSIFIPSRKWFPKFRQTNAKLPKIKLVQ